MPSEPMQQQAMHLLACCCSLATDPLSPGRPFLTDPLALNQAFIFSLSYSESPKRTTRGDQPKLEFSIFSFLSTFGLPGRPRAKGLTVVVKGKEHVFFTLM